jgi:sugar phosphate isomerase/epimerase
LGGALPPARVELYSVLIDRGNITAPDAVVRDTELQFIRGWIDIAAELGAGRVRIDAGLEPPTPEVIRLSAAGLSELADYARAAGVRVITENWHATSRQPGPLLEILDRCNGAVGLCADLGNAEGHDKYETLALLLPRATSIHFKVRYDGEAGIERTDFDRCVSLIEAARFDGPMSLIYNETDREWAAVDQLREAMVGSMPALAVGS